eukprot:XP_001702003.1 predicted protein [Chlamydomonas reinhardtii]
MSVDGLAVGGGWAGSRGNGGAAQKQQPQQQPQAAAGNMPGDDGEATIRALAFSPMRNGSAGSGASATAPMYMATGTGPQGAAALAGQFAFSR